MTEAPHIAILPRTHLSLHQEQDIIALCSRAYGQDFSDLLTSFEDTTHVLAYLDRQLVSHALWIARTLTYQGTALHSAYVEAVATEPHYQGRGYASHVLRALAAAITSFDIGALSPSDPAFYARLGWEQWRGPLAVATDAGITPTPDSSVMIFWLPNRPPLDLYGTLIAPWREGDIW
jgi:aminoglycoside 2'-N-acetyltransferase I